MAVTIRLATEDDLPALVAVGDDLFDHPIKRERAREFLNDPRHHLFIAVEGEAVIGMASGLHYVHPDKDPELFVNEVGVVDAHQNRQIGRELVRRLVEHGRSIGCQGAWVATEYSNLPARRAYAAAGGCEEPEPAVVITFDQDDDAAARR